MRTAYHISSDMFVQYRVKLGTTFTAHSTTSSMKSPHTSPTVSPITIKYS